MKRRGSRLTLTVAMVGVALVTVLVAFNWATVRDNAEAWWFQATRETFTAEPPLVRRYHGFGDLPGEAAFQLLAELSGLAVVYDSERNLHLRVALVALKRGWEEEPSLVIRAMCESGYRIIGQRFPRRAYVVVAYPEVQVSDIPLGGPLENTH